MRFPDTINYLLTLKYPGSEESLTDWVCYNGGAQFIIPFIGPGQSVQLRGTPQFGRYAYIGFYFNFGKAVVPNVFSITISQYGTNPISGIITERLIEEGAEYFIITTEQEPSYFSLTNISPLPQTFESFSRYIIVPTVENLKTIIDGLRRLHTSKETESLLQQAVHQLGILSGHPQQPQPPVGGSQWL